ncbi:MAG: hypothetical protein K6T65_12930 [Peptococcaceae bacterium]|nr:hypothetical protein [Peptococcaceae bacterium]
MNPVQKAINIIENLSAEKLYAALYVLELIASGDVKTDSQDILALEAFEMSCEKEELTPSEVAAVIKGESELEAGMGVKAEDVWKELGL